MFNGTKLKELRLVHRYTVNNLANMLEIDSALLWNFENEYDTPDFNDINNIKYIFGVKPGFLYSDSFIELVDNANNIAFRSNEVNEHERIEMESYYINYLDYYLSYFLEYLSIMYFNLDKLFNDYRKYYYGNKSIDKYKKLKYIAEDFRNYIGLDDNNDLMYRLEYVGISVIEQNLKFDEDAYSTFMNNKYYIILKKGTAAARRNFNMAHEIGHLILHADINMQTIDVKNYKRLEREANTFASSFLLKENDFIKDFKSVRNPSRIEDYIGLKKKYKVSIQAMQYRAYKLGLINEDQNKRFYQNLYYEGYKKYEPLDSELLVKIPGKIRQILDLFFTEVMDLDEFLNNFNVDSSFIERIFGLKENELDKYNHDYDIKDRVKVLNR